MKCLDIDIFKFRKHICFLFVPFYFYVFIYLCIYLLIYLFIYLAYTKFV